MRKLTTEQWIEKARAVHGDRYDYSNTEYIRSRDRLVIACRDHGEFTQLPDSHIRGCGCKTCGYIKNVNEQSKTTVEFIADSIRLWGDRYEYSMVDYTSNKNPVTMTCKEHGYAFDQRPDKHLRGQQGCPYCSSRPRGAGMVYLIEVHVPDTDEKFIKIGWTTSNVRTRFREDAFEWKQLNRKMFPNAYLGERWERYIQNMFDDCRYKPKHSFGGETECFGYQYKELIQKTFAEEAKRGN